MTLIDRIDGPEDLRGLSEEELQTLAQEVREHIIETVGEIGGHFGANLGTCDNRTLRKLCRRARRALPDRR